MAVEDSDVQDSDVQGRVVELSNEQGRDVQGSELKCGLGVNSQTTTNPANPVEIHVAHHSVGYGIPDHVQSGHVEISGV